MRASLWEAAIKHSLGKLDLGRPFAELIPDQLEANSISVLGIDVPHVVRLIALPFHHRDPFDRLIIVEILSRRFFQRGDVYRFKLVLRQTHVVELHVVLTDTIRRFRAELRACI